MEKINVAGLLKNCPKGMELDCTIYENASFIGVTENVNFPIHVKINFENVEEKSWTRELTLTSEGKLGNHPNAKCIIFPKGKTTWEGFVPPCQFKDGDVIVANGYFGTIAIFKQVHSLYEELYVDFYCGVTSKNRCFIIKAGEAQHCGKISSFRLATEEEKTELFRAIKDNGYRWDEETKTLEKLPKFKVGDRIWLKENHNYIHTITGISEEENKYVCGVTFVLRFSKQDDWELVPNKFDIATLKPFDKVLVRDFDNETWEINFFSKLLDGKHFKCLDLSYVQCIPYEGNEHLFNTTNKCDEFYKTWKK